jgi:hypothetical protein
MQTTIKAMKRVAEIKRRREHTFWKNRCVHKALKMFYILIGFEEWRPPEKNTVQRAPKNSLPVILSSWSSPCPYRTRQKFGKKLQYRQSDILRWWKALGDLWGWKSTEAYSRFASVVTYIRN